MIYKSHLIEIWVNGKKLELESQKSLNLRFQNVLFNPEKIASTQAEYSFEFEIPSTPRNDQIFEYANNLSKLNKFHSRWDAQVYADGNKIFEGSMTLNSYKDKKYKVNLVSVKNYSLDDIFGESVLTDIPWYIPFDGNGYEGYTINYYNDETSNFRRDDVCFPLISYGVFQKSPKSKDDVGSEYTSKFDLDKYNLWYTDSFYPSLSMLETMKKSFEYKGYSVGGDAFTNELLKNVFMSTNLADEQDPTYNLGNPKFGKVELSVNWTTPMNGSAYTQDLNFPYWRIGGSYDTDQGTIVGSNWNFSSIQVYDMLSEGTVSVSNPSYLYQPNEHIIVIPSDGFYKISLSGTSHLVTASSFRATQYCRTSCTSSSAEHIEESEVTIPANFRKTMPIEIQLVRNYDDNIELIKGENNYNIRSGNPSEQTFCNMANAFNTTCCFPHEKAGSVFYAVGIASISSDIYMYAPPTDITKFGDANNRSLFDFEHNVGYIYNNGDIMAYDPAVSKAFICGFTSMGNDNGGGCISVMKNGYSWSKLVSDKNYAFYNQQGYYAANTPLGFVPTWEIYATATTFNSNSYDGSFSYFSSNDHTINGNIDCMVYLNKGDVLQLYAVQRDYNDTDSTQQQYQVTSNYKLSIEAASPKSYDELRAENFNYNSPTEFDQDLRLSNFLNKETKISDWVQNVIDAFNLEIIQDGKNVSINTKNEINTKYESAVDIDDRTNSDNAESQMINYPRSMAVKYKIDAEEWGAEKSVIDAYGQGKMNEADWKKYIDSGYTVIQLNDDSYVTSTSDKSLQFSYTWYDNFKWYEVDYSGQQNPNSDPITLRMPVISKYSYMIDGYDYEESMKHNGYGLTQRFWFRPTKTNAYVWTETYPKERNDIYIPSNSWSDVCNLSYKNTEKSILTNFFNINSYLSSNYVEIDAYLTPIEYNRLKNGALVHFDSDLYYVVELNGYDPSGYNLTTLKLMKKVV